jgi:cellulose synthase/poly-beta-1,6-N-acetylglucosamine synthase-like glycosyltransferase
MTISLIIILLLLLFVFRFILVILGLMKEKSKKLPELPTDKHPFVSVIVPARNEEDTIVECLRAIHANSYPKDKYEIIAINDRSTDKTGDLIFSLKNEIPNLILINLNKDRKEENLKGKPGAIQSCIKNANGEILLFTDADCKPVHKWIETMVRGFQDSKLGLISSFTNVSGKKIFDRLQSLEWLYLNAIGSAAIGWNKPMSCFGNNLAVRKSDFLAVGGYEKIKFSVTEDLALLHAIHDSGKLVRYLPHQDSLVFTKPNKTFRDYFRQHHRWVVGAKDIGILSFLFVLTSLAMWLSLLLSIIMVMPLWAGGILLSRFIMDYVIINYAVAATQSRIYKVWIVPAVFFFMIMELIAPFLLLKKQIVWKEQTFKKKK